jgi:VWFA-related protein
MNPVSVEESMMNMQRWAGVMLPVLCASALSALVVGLLADPVRGQGPNRSVGRGATPETPPEERDVANPADPFNLSIDVELVGVDVIVTDDDGNPITGLEKEDFRVLVDDVEQPISTFSPTESPVTVVLILEFGNTFGYYYDDIVGPAGGFINSLREDDWAAIVAYDLEPNIVTDFSQSKSDLFYGLQSLVFPTFSETNLFDAVHFTLDRLENVDGKKAIFLMSTGIDTFSRANYGETLKRTEASDVVIYAVGMAQLYRTVIENRISNLDRMTFLQAEVALRSLAENTGGMAFFPRFSGEYPGIYETVSYMLRYQYSLGFIPTGLEEDDDLREIEIELRPIDVDGDGEPDKLETRHKKGFYTERDEDAG